MNARVAGTIFFLLVSLHGVLSFGRRRSYKPRPEADSICDSHYDPEEDQESHPADPYCNCSLAGFSKVQKITYTKHPAVCEPSDGNFSSACVRCGLCLAIAEQINETLLDTHEAMKCNVWLNNTEATVLLRAICENAFKQYSLQEVAGRKYISGKPSSLVASVEDIVWQKKLRDTCHEYLDEIEPVELYERWRQWCLGDESDPDLITVLCRSEAGILRDCRNIEISGDLEEPFSSYPTTLKITAEHSC